MKTAEDHRLADGRGEMVALEVGEGTRWQPGKSKGHAPVIQLLFQVCDDA